MNKNLLQIIAVKKKAILAGFFVAVIVLSVFFLTTGKISAAVEKYKILPQDEYFTELYLNNRPSSLREVQVGEVLPISFVIANNESANKSYKYVVYLQTPELGNVSIAEGTIFVVKGTRKVIDVRLLLSPNITSSSMLLIDLPELDQSIHFKVIENYE